MRHTEDRFTMSPIFNRSRRVFALSAIVVVTAIGHARGQSNTPPAKVEMLGPKIGDALSDFSLRDQRGEARTLKSLLGPNGAVIVFFRSADW
jgi:cytochrome oxidase Cu insertion factor (SCO1/SenC/PrrC family)